MRKLLIGSMCIKTAVRFAAVFVICTTLTASAQSVDDAVIEALNAEIAQTGNDDNGKAGKKAEESKADDLIKAIDAEMSELDEKDDDKTGGGGKKSDRPQGRTGKRASRDSKGVIISAQGRGKTKASAERAACCMAVVRALRIYAGDEAVKDKFDAVKARMKTVVNDVIDKHEVIEEGQKDGHPVVKVKAWIKKRALAPKFSDMFPEAFEGVEAEVSSPVGKAASPDRISAASTASGYGVEGSHTMKDSSVITVTVTGKGETKEEAKLAAFRAAVEKAVGVWVDAESIMQNSEMLKDRVNTISNADIQRYETINEGRLKSGLYACKIKAWVEKKAIAPKFASVFPAAFKDVGEAASAIHVNRVTRRMRSNDAASLMTATLKDVNRMRNWVRLSVVKGKGLEEVNKIKQYRNSDLDVAEVPGKGLYSVRYSMKIDEEAYFKGFLPHFKEMLTKMQEGEAEENVVLTSSLFDKRNASFGCIENDGDGRMILVTDNGNYDLPPDIKPFTRGGGKIGNTFFVEPIVLAGFPGLAPNESLGWSDSLGNGSFMFDYYDSNRCKINGKRSYNIWLLDKMNKDRTSVRCSAYKVPVSALRSYWNGLCGSVDSSGYVTPKIHEKVEIVLLDERGDEISARVDDHVPAMLLSSGPVPKVFRFLHCNSLNVFNSFFIRPMFVNYSLYPGSMGRDNGTTCYSTEIQREVYFPLTDAQLEKVKKVKVRFVGGKRK